MKNYYRILMDKNFKDLSLTELYEIAKRYEFYVSDKDKVKFNNELEFFLSGTYPFKLFEDITKEKLSNLILKYLDPYVLDKQILKEKEDDFFPNYKGFVDFLFSISNLFIVEQKELIDYIFECNIDDPYFLAKVNVTIFKYKEGKKPFFPKIDDVIIYDHNFPNRHKEVKYSLSDLGLSELDKIIRETYKNSYNHQKILFAEYFFDGWYECYLYYKY